MPPSLLPRNRTSRITDLNQPVAQSRCFDCGNVTQPNERPTCSVKGDCDRFGRDVKIAGVAASSAIVAWVRAHCGEETDAARDEDPHATKNTDNAIDQLSVWGVCVAVRGDARSATQPIGFVILCHALLMPHRIIALRLRRQRNDVSDLLEFGETLGGCFEFQTVFEFLHHLDIDWCNAFEVYINRYAWAVEGWDCLSIGGRITSDGIWPCKETHRVVAGSSLKDAMNAGRTLLVQAAGLARPARAKAKAKARAKVKTSALSRSVREAMKMRKRGPAARRAILATPAPLAALPAPSAPVIVELPGPVVEVDVAERLERELPFLGPPAPPPLGSASSSSSSTRTGGLGGAVAVPLRPHKQTGTDFDFVRTVVGAQRFNILRGEGYSVVFENPAHSFTPFGVYIANHYSRFQSTSARKGIEQIEGSRKRLRDADDHARVIRNVYNVIAADSNANEWSTPMTALLVPAADVLDQSDDDLSSASEALSFEELDTDVDVM